MTSARDTDTCGAVLYREVCVALALKPPSYARRLPTELTSQLGAGHCEIKTNYFRLAFSL